MKWLTLLVLAGCMTPVMKFGEGKSAKQAQHDTLEDLRPTQLSTEQRGRTAVKDAKIRVYADDAYRAQNRNWRQAFDERLAYANEVLTATLGVRLLAEYREWNHHSPGATLADDLAHLQQLDAGSDVLTVVGVTSSLSLVSATFDQLGVASSPGRHMMLRGYADLEERKAFEAAFPDLSAAERISALDQRRRHKTAAILLHELGHNLGMDHESNADTLMHAMYSLQASSFSTEAHAVIQRNLDRRLGRESAETAPVAAAAPKPPKPRPKLEIVMLVDGLIVNGKQLVDDSLNMTFSAQAALDPETEVVIAREKDVPMANVVKLIDRAKAQGLKNISFK